MGKAVYPGREKPCGYSPKAPSPRFILFSSLARVAQLREGFAVEDLKGTPGKVPQNAPIAQGPDNAAYRAPMQAEHKGQLGLRHAGVDHAGPALIGQPVQIPAYLRLRVQLDAFGYLAVKGLCLAPSEGPGLLISAGWRRTTSASSSRVRGKL